MNVNFSIAVVFNLDYSAHKETPCFKYFIVHFIKKRCFYCTEVVDLSQQVNIINYGIILGDIEKSKIITI